MPVQIKTQSHVNLPGKIIFPGKYILVTITLCFSLLCKSQSYTDLKDQDYHGAVKQVVTKFYSAPTAPGNGWQIQDSLHPQTTLVEYFNEKGNYIRKEMFTPYDTSTIFYDYSLAEKITWLRKRKNGSIAETALIVNAGPNQIRATVKAIDDSSTSELYYSLGKNKRTQTLEEKGYDAGGKITYHLVNRNADDKNGKYWKTIIEDKLEKKTTTLDFQFLKKDRFGNAIEVLEKTNGKVSGMRRVAFFYYQ